MTSARRCRGSINRLFPGKRRGDYVPWFAIPMDERLSYFKIAVDSGYLPMQNRLKMRSSKSSV